MDFAPSKSPGKKDTLNGICVKLVNSPPPKEQNVFQNDLIVGIASWKNLFLCSIFPAIAVVLYLEVPKRHPPKGHPQKLLEFDLNSVPV